MDLRRQQREHALIHIDGTALEKMKSFKFLCVHITDNLKFSTTQTVWRRRPNRCTIKSILLGCINAWYGNYTFRSHRALQRVMPSAPHINGGTLSALQDTYRTQCHRTAKKIIKDINHQSHGLFTPLSSRRRGPYRCIKAGTERLKNSISRPSDC
jgi:hypothetical protein